MIQKSQKSYGRSQTEEDAISSFCEDISNLHLESEEAYEEVKNIEPGERTMCKM